MYLNKRRNLLYFNLNAPTPVAGGVDVPTPPAPGPITGPTGPAPVPPSGPAPISPTDPPFSDSYLEGLDLNSQNCLSLNGLQLYISIWMGKTMSAGQRAYYKTKLDLVKALQASKCATTNPISTVPSITVPLGSAVPVVNVGDSAIGGGGAGGGGGSASDAKNKNWLWWLLAIAVVGLCLYETRKGAPGKPLPSI